MESLMNAKTPIMHKIITYSLSPPQPTCKLTLFMNECMPGGDSCPFHWFLPFSLVDSREP